MELLKIVEENSLGETIDLSSGAHLMLFITDKEETDAMADYVAAKAAALEVSEVEWLSKETMQGVRPLLCFRNMLIIMHTIILSGVRHIFLWLPPSRTQPLAPQACDTTFYACISA